MDVIREFVDGIIDFEGQKLADSINFYTIWAGAVLSLAAGYITQSVVVASYVSLFSLVLALVLVVPSWPFYNTKPVKWLTPAGFLAATTTTTDTKGAISDIMEREPSNDGTVKVEI